MNAKKKKGKLVVDLIVQVHGIPSHINNKELTTKEGKNAINCTNLMGCFVDANNHYVAVSGKNLDMSVIYYTV